jgi:heme A synthase
VNWRVVAMLIGVLLIGLLLWVWLHRQPSPPRDPLRGLGPGVYQPPKPQSGEVLPLRTNVPH